MSFVVWHDVECGSYLEDLPLWRELAEGCETAILDLGAGTGRVAIDLAHHGHEVLALDLEEELLAECRLRAGDLPVRTVQADARAFDLDGERFDLILAPMQTVQLLGGAGRGGLLRSVRRHLNAGGIAACALADALEAFDADHVVPPLPDVGRIEGVVYSSQPVALREEGNQIVIERIRTTLAPGGARTAEGDRIALDRLDAVTLEGEAAAAGLRPLPPRRIGETGEHVGSVVVMLGG